MHAEGSVDNLRGILGSLDDDDLDLSTEYRNLLKQGLPPFVEAMQTILSENVTEDQYNRAMQTLSGFPAFLNTRTNGRLTYGAISNVGKQKLFYAEMEDCAEELASLEQLTDLGLTVVPAVREAYRKLIPVNRPPQEAPAAQGVNPVVQAEPNTVGPLNNEANREAANRLKSHFLGVANSMDNAAPAQIRTQLPLYAQAIADLGTDGLVQQKYEDARAKLSELKEFLLLQSGNGTLCYERLARKCGAQAGEPTENALQQDLKVLDETLHLGLDNLEQDISRITILRCDKLETLRYRTTDWDPESLNRLEQDFNHRDVLQNLTALQVSLKSYDDRHKENKQFSELVESLNTLRLAICGENKKERNAESYLATGRMGRNLLAAWKKLQNEDKTIQDPQFNKGPIRTRLKRVAISLGFLHPDLGINPEEYRQQRAREQQMAQQRREEKQREDVLKTRFPNTEIPLNMAVRNAMTSVRNYEFPMTSRDNKLNRMIGLFTVLSQKVRDPNHGNELIDRNAAVRLSDSLYQDQEFKAFLMDNLDRLRQGMNTERPDDFQDTLENVLLNAPRMPEKMPEGLLPRANKLTENRIAKVNAPGFANKSPDEKVRLLAEILAARDVVGSIRHKEGSLKHPVTAKFFTRVRELEQCKTFRDFVLDGNRTQEILRSLRGRTHGGAMEEMFKKYVLQLPQLPDDIPARFMPTALERIDALKKVVASNAFRNFDDADKQRCYLEILAARMAVNCGRDAKNTLNFVLNGDALAKARQKLLSDPAIADNNVLADPRMRGALKKGHGGRMEDILAEYNSTGSLNTNAEPRHQPTAKEWINRQLRTLRNDASSVIDRRNAAARIMATIECYGNDLNRRIGQNGPSAGTLHTRAERLAGDGVFQSICNAALPNAAAMNGARNPVQLLSQNFTNALSHTMMKPLAGDQAGQPAFDGPAYNPQLANLDAVPAFDAQTRFQSNRELLHEYHMEDNQINENWRLLNRRTVQRALAETVACQLMQNKGTAITEQNLFEKSTQLMESKEWQIFFGQKNTLELQNLLVNSNNLQQAAEQITNGVRNAQPAPVVPLAAPQAQHVPEGIQPV